MRGGVFVRLRFRIEESAGHERKEEKGATAKAPTSSIAQIMLAGARRPDVYERLIPQLRCGEWLLAGGRWPREMG